MVGNLFGSSNSVLNMNIHQKDRSKLNPMLGLGGAIKVQQSANSWLKNNLDIDLDELPVIEERTKGDDRIKSAIPNRRRNAETFSRSGSQTALQKMPYGGAGTLSEANLADFNGSAMKNKNKSLIVSSHDGGRPMSAATYTT